MLDVEPGSVVVKVIDQILVTSVKTRPLTVDEIKPEGHRPRQRRLPRVRVHARPELESKPVNFTFPVVFDRQGVVVPQPLMPPPAPDRSGVSLPPLPLIVAMLLEAESRRRWRDSKVPLTTPDGEPIRIPSVLVIPGNVGYLKQFFSAQLFVANGAPVGSNLVVRDVLGTI